MSRRMVLWCLNCLPLSCLRRRTTPDAADQNIFLAGFTIDDDETQTYVLSLDGTMHTSQNPPKEGEAISLVIEAKPAAPSG